MAGIYTCCWMRIPWLDHVPVKNVFNAQSINHYITYIAMHRRPGVGHFQSDFSDQFHFKAQIARSQPFMLIRASCLAVIQVLDCKCISCDRKQTRFWLSPPSPHIHWHGVCRPKQHPMTFSHTTPGCFSWNSSPTQILWLRCVNLHITSAIYILYQSFQP